MANKIQINYKSGISAKVSCDEFKIGYHNSELTRYEGEGMKPRPLFIGMNDIESIWELS